MGLTNEDIQMNLAIWTASQQLLTRYDMERLKGSSPVEAERYALLHLEVLEGLTPQLGKGYDIADTCRVLLRSARERDESS